MKSRKTRSISLWLLIFAVFISTPFLVDISYSEKSPPQLTIVPFDVLNYCLEIPCAEPYKNLKTVSENRNGDRFLIVEIPLPRKQKTGLHLYLPNVMEIFEIFADDQKIYATGDMEKASGSVFYGIESHLVLIPEQIKKNKLILRVYSGNRFLIGPVKDLIAIGTPEAIENWIIKKDLSQMLVSFLFFTIFLITSIFVVFYRNLVLIYYGILNLFFAVYTCNLTDFYQFHYKNPAFTIVAWDISITAIIIFFTLFFQSAFRRYRVYLYLNFVIILFSIVKFSVIGINSFNEWTIIQNILLISTTLTVPPLCFQMFYKEKNQHALIFGLIVLFAHFVGIVESFSNNLQHSMGSNIHYLFFALNIFSGVIVLKQYQSLENRNLMMLKKIEKEHQLLEQMRYEKLQARMNPHFLFNTLNILNSYILTKPMAAYEALQHISSHYRYLFDETNIDLVSLKQEIDFTQNYLDLLRFRFENDIWYKANFSGDVKNIFLPPLSIQPLVENAYFHGIRNSGRKGRIKINVTVRDIVCEIFVVDNGPGLKSDFSGSRTLDNIEERLKHFYSNVETEITNYGSSGMGTIQRIKFSERIIHEPI